MAQKKLGIVTHTCDTIIWEVEAGVVGGGEFKTRALGKHWVWDEAALYKEFLTGEKEPQNLQAKRSLRLSSVSSVILTGLLGNLCLFCCLQLIRVFPALKEKDKESWQCGKWYFRVKITSKSIRHCPVENELGLCVTYQVYCCFEIRIFPN